MLPLQPFHNSSISILTMGNRSSIIMQGFLLQARNIHLFMVWTRIFLPLGAHAPTHASIGSCFGMCAYFIVHFVYRAYFFVNDFLAHRISV